MGSYVGNSGDGGAAQKVTGKGDLIVGTSAGSVDNIAIGTDGQILKADSTTSTGVKWANESSIAEIQSKAIAMALIFR